MLPRRPSWTSRTRRKPARPRARGQPLHHDLRVDRVDPLSAHGPRHVHGSRHGRLRVGWGSGWAAGSRSAPPSRRHTCISSLNGRKTYIETSSLKPKMHLSNSIRISNTFLRAFAAGFCSEAFGGSRI
eukprot:4946279-Pyramimonas_sp.AAC.1